MDKYKVRLLLIRLLKKTISKFNLNTLLSALISKVSILSISN